MSDAEDLAKITEIFRKFDRNRNGFIEKDEFLYVLGRLDPGKWDAKAVDGIIVDADVDKDGMIDYEELLKWVFKDEAEPSDLVTAILISAESIAYPLDDQIVQELTWARTKPQEVADILKARRGQYRGKEFFPADEDGKKCIVTKEGWPVVQEAIEFLEEQAKDPIGGVGFYSVNGLAQAGEDHCADIGQTGTASHESSDGTIACDRIYRYGRFRRHGQCLWYGSEDSDARKMVIDLIVDDGVASRGHRLGVYNADYECCGTAYGPHRSFGRVVAIEFAQGWTEDKEAVAARIINGPVVPDAAIIEAAKARATTTTDRGTCPVCKEKIMGGKVMNIAEAEKQMGNGEIHFDCFKCVKCDKHLKGVPFKIHEKSFWCSACHAEEHGDKCDACGKAITGGMMKCALGVFHVECLICSQCSCAIGKARFSTAGGVMTCSRCSSGVAARGGSGVGKRGRSGSPEPRAAGNSSARSKSGSPSPKASPAPKAKGKAKAKAKGGGVSMGGAHGATMGIAMDYASLG